MNEKIFTELLEQLEDASWQAVLNGGAILMINDQLLEIGSISNSTVIIKNTLEIFDVEGLKRHTLDNVVKILSDYYVINPLSLAGFNQQVECLITEKGARSFVANSGSYPEFTLFVDGGEVIVESSQSPRFRYGAFCELEQPVAESDIQKYVSKWVKSGEAYQLYLNMNVCRFNC